MPFDPPTLPAIDFPWSPRDTNIERRHVGAWALKVETDRFTGRLTCSLSKPRIRYERQALAFQLSSGANTFDAAYRVDDAPPVSARSDAMELARQGFALHNDDLANPSGGLVRIPLGRLSGAQAVRIQSRPNTIPVRFKIDGLSEALAAAQSAGCGFSDFK